MRFCNLCEKTVINVEDCCALGNVSDVEINECDGCIRALVVRDCSRFWKLISTDKEMVIPWQQVVRIGPDIILVRICKK